MGSVSYDPEEDILYVSLRDDKVDHSVRLDDLRIIDYTEDNAVVGFEFIGASGGVDVRDIPFSQTVEKLIGRSGHTFKIFA